MRLIRTEIQITAPAARVWSILTDFKSYPSWNSFIQEIAGKAEVGALLTVKIVPPGHKPMTFKPRVLAAAPNRELRWLGRIMLPGLFDGEHSFELSDNSQSCLFRQSEEFSGILVPLMGAKMFEATRQGFMAMNDALRKRAQGA